MIFSHFQKETLIAYVNYYKQLIQIAEGSNRTNLIDFMEQCDKELVKQSC